VAIQDSALIGFADEDERILQDTLAFYQRVRRVPWHDELLEWHARQLTWLPEFEQFMKQLSLENQ
jgi:hypothetical protein